LVISLKSDYKIISAKVTEKVKPGQPGGTKQPVQLLLERGAVEVAGLVSKAYCFDGGLFCFLEPD